jgi:hypothetical protein
MRFTFVLRDRRGDLVNVPAQDAKASDRSDAVAVRVVCKQDDATAAKALLMKSKTLGFEGTLKQGFFADGSVWMTIGRREAASSNADAFSALLG